MKYIAYCRKSTDEKDKQVLSIEAQIAELTEFAKREKLEIVQFITEAKTAKAPGRKKFAEVLHLLEIGVAQGIISWHPDRLARNSIDGGKIIYFLDIGKILDLKFPSFWFENTPQGKFMLNIAFGQSKYYVDNLSENVKRGNRQKLRRGEFPGRAPMGYFNDPKLRTIEIDPKKSKYIKKAFEMFAKGESATAVNKFLYKNGIRRKDNRLLHMTSIRKMITNKLYIGIIKYAGEYYTASHKCFIPKELFQKVQEVLKTKVKNTTDSNFAFLGFARCGECGASITGEKHWKNYPTTRGKIKYIYYRCTKKLKPCTQKYLEETKFTDQLRQVIASVALPQEWEKDWRKRIERDEFQEKRNAEKNISRLKLETKTIDKKLNFLLDSYLESVINADIYKKKKNELFEEKIRIQEEILKIDEDGSGWLEPMKEFVDGALQCRKIARAKNTKEDLAIFAKTVGSNFFLTDRWLSVEYKLGFATLFSELSTPHCLSAKTSNSRMVDSRGLEPNFSGHWRARTVDICDVNATLYQLS